MDLLLSPQCRPNSGHSVGQERRLQPFSRRRPPGVRLAFGPVSGFAKAEWPFAHALAGFTNDFADGPGLANTSGNEFSMKLGGGLDLSVSKHFAVG